MMTNRTLLLLLTLSSLAIALGCDDLESSGAIDEADAGVADGSSDTGIDTDGSGGPVIDDRFGEETPIEFDATVDATFADFEAYTVNYDAAGSGFYRLPWPSNARRQANGRPEMSDFPNPGEIDLLYAYVDVIEATADGFSNLPVIYAGLQAGWPVESLPEPPQTIEATSPVQLIALDAERCGERIPLEVTLASGDGYIPAGTLEATPLNGWVLPAKSTYAFVVLRSWGNDQGVTLAPPAAFRAALSGDSSAESASFEPLRDCLPVLEMDPSEWSFASVFTTQDPVRETRLMREAALTVADDPRVVEWVEEPSYSNAQWTTYGGRFTAPIFQTGTTPYASIGSGGGLVFGADGLPVIQRYEEVPFSIAFPVNAEGPVPVLVWEDGTAVSATDDRRVQFGHIGDDPFKAAISRGFAVANFQPQFHAGRSGPTADEVIHSFNFLNPESGRTAFRQQVADTSFFVRLLDNNQAEMPGIPQLDTGRMVYGGHSQGAIIGAMVAGVEDRFNGYFINGVGAVLGIVVVERRDPIDINQTLSSVLGLGRNRLDKFHPVVQLAQLGADPVDPANYVRFWKGWDQNPAGNSVLMSNGFLDDTTHHTQISSIMIAADAAPVQPAGWDVDPWGLWNQPAALRPIFGNRRSIDGSPLTIAGNLDANQGHFTIYRNAAVMEMGAEFWLSALDGVPIVPR
jgi:hypothetical protein